MRRDPHRSLVDRLLFNSYLDRRTGCWIWLGHVNRYGYATVTLRRQGDRLPVPVPAYKIAVREFRGEKIEALLEIDHLCRNKRCINPDHLEQTTRTINLSRRVFKSAAS